MNEIINLIVTMTAFVAVGGLVLGVIYCVDCYRENSR